MANGASIQVCKTCGASGSGKYCSACGQPFVQKRITAREMLHDVFHFFTHLDKGFGFTLKSLITQPGTMQRTFVEGDRARHQKPFSMFFICATILAVSRYWLNQTLVHYYHVGLTQEANFFHQYMVMVQIVMMPVYSFIVFLFFRNTRYNYGELLVLMLYTVGLLFLIVSVIQLLKFIWPNMDTAPIELPVLMVYNIITFVHFFNESPRWVVVVKSILVLLITFLISHYLEKGLIHLLY